MNSQLTFQQRWRLAHTLAPVLIGAFANSPFARGRPNGYRSGRQAVWSRIDASRARPAWCLGDTDPRAAFARYALEADVLCVRGDSGEWTAPKGLTFRSWLRGDGPRPPTIDDLNYHLTTLFPPVRPRGHLEIRYVDAQPGDDWMVSAAVIAALLDDHTAADAAAEATEPFADDGAALERSSRAALRDPVIGRAAATCFAAALGALGRMGAADLRPAVESFIERYVDRQRCPADERLDHWRRTGSVHLQETVTC